MIKMETVWICSCIFSGGPKSDIEMYCKQFEETHPDLLIMKVSLGPKCKLQNLWIFNDERRLYSHWNIYLQEDKIETIAENINNKSDAKGVVLIDYPVSQEHVDEYNTKVSNVTFNVSNDIYAQLYALLNWNSLLYINLSANLMAVFSLVISPSNKKIWTRNEH